MLRFILNNEGIATDQPSGMTVLDFVRYHKNLKGTKIGCREGDCGACTVLVGELIDGMVRYRSMTSCLMPLANAAGKHIVTIEGINPTDGSLTPVQQAMVDESGTQCGFCTVGFVMSLTGFCLGTPTRSPVSSDQAISSIDGNICRCTGYKSIERAACRIGEQLPVNIAQYIPEYFSDIALRLQGLGSDDSRPETSNLRSLVGGGTDLYVQRHDQMSASDPTPLLYDDRLRSIRNTDEHIEIGGSATVTDLLESPVMHAIFPHLYKHLKLVSSTPIRNMATLAGNFVNASPIGDMTVWFLALDAEIELMPGTQAPSPASQPRTINLKDLYLGYKQLAKQPDEIISKVRFKKPASGFKFNFEKVCKRTYLDIATVNTAISLTYSPPYEGGVAAASADGVVLSYVHVAAGGVAPIPLYLKRTSEFLRGKEITEETIAAANEIIQAEISPISDVRGTEQYKRLLIRQLFRAHFVELFGT
ncbi:MAG: FAD binding domain-containing protein [Acidobacteria bacterium]|nr:FAD binding domain-containing protein [Acidobacteriota bacterium]MCW5948694.1 FAD binding domain-containing protein [Pyrinomonadaceae bacterium]